MDKEKLSPPPMGMRYNKYRCPVCNEKFTLLQADFNQTERPHEVYYLVPECPHCHKNNKLTVVTDKDLVKSLPSRVWTHIVKIWGVDPLFVIFAVSYFITWPVHKPIGLLWQNAGWPIRSKPWGGIKRAKRIIDKQRQLQINNHERIDHAKKVEARLRLTKLQLEQAREEMADSHEIIAEFGEPEPTMKMGGTPSKNRVARNATQIEKLAMRLHLISQAKIDCTCAVCLVTWNTRREARICEDGHDLET